MKLSVLREYFEGTRNSDSLKDELKGNIAEYSERLKKRGSSVPIHLIQDTKLSFGEKELSMLATSFLTGGLTSLELGYIADALLLSDQVDFKSEKVMDALEQLTDAEVNGEITETSVREMLHDIK
jgi:hypothetical protein